MDNQQNPMEGREIAGQTLSWMRSPEQQPKPESLSVHPLIRQAVLELATRYRPNNAAENEPFQAKVALLTKDLALVNPHALKDAADEWARREKWLPKASELIDLIKESRGPGGTAIDLAALYNARLATDPNKRGMKWIYDAGGQLKLISTARHSSSFEMIPPRDPQPRQPYAD